ncbi:flagellar biosynthesis protein FlaG [Pseudomonas prosekii]|uniref:Flagellar biosynthesis protein FlaG n=1 Tax=Pseudomonas prosekii TaxID=1148509 RepID=A0A1H1QHY3_9PSED|nr:MULTISPECIES: flagellar protein FlaG [Pseudomonas]PKH23177.1 flagellar biosynthesis protein FlaG [Pseudomonas sp. 43NM1]PWE43783.1 flagellar biosynthesis protein FlaG [Pseudomonas prosekii]PWE47100.1 flagellar biosynthesis protein FlaG [Pseudomonas prosekii]SDS22937.1 flagellar protein FlaG [Pseudomonas prosekii]
MDMSVKLNLSYPAAKPTVSTTEKPVDKPRAESTQAVAANSSESGNPDNSEKLKTAVQEIEKFVQSVKRNLEFSIDETSGKVIVKVIASESGEVIRQIPSAEAMKLAESLHNASNVLFDAKA